MNEWDAAYSQRQSTPVDEPAHDDTASNWFWGIVAIALTLVWTGWLAVWALELVQ